MSEPLTKNDVTALRNADTLTAHWLTEGRHVLRAHFDEVRAEDKPYQPASIVEVEVKGRVTNFAGQGFAEDRYPYREVDNAYAHLGHPRYNGVVRTFAELVRPGDTLELHWFADNNSGTIVKAGLHADELRVTIARKTPGGKVRSMELLLETSICEQNSARMIRLGAMNTGRTP